jgi:hypothetical protein
MVDATGFAYGAIGGLIGGGVYVAYNHLVQQKLYLSAIWHLVAGGIAGLAGIFVLGYAVPESATWAAVFPLVVLGYFGTDVVDSLAQDIAAKNPTTPAPPTTQ